MRVAILDILSDTLLGGKAGRVYGIYFRKQFMAITPQAIAVWFFAKLFGRMPSDYHVWILTDGAPAFVKFEGALNPTGPVWQIELTSPRWPE